MKDEDINEKIKQILTPPFDTTEFILEFKFNEKHYSIRFMAEYIYNQVSDKDTITILLRSIRFSGLQANLEDSGVVPEDCILIMYTPMLNGKPVNDLFGSIHSNSVDRQCFHPTLESDAINVPNRTTSTDVLQVLKTRLCLCFPQIKSISINDAAIKDNVALSSFFILRGKDALYEKYGYVSPIVSQIKSDIWKARWSDVDNDYKPLILKALGSDEDNFKPETLLTDIMNNISFDDESNYNTTYNGSLSYQLFLWFGLKYGYSKKMPGVSEIPEVYKIVNDNIFTLDSDSTQWIHWKSKLFFTSIELIVSGGKRNTRRKKVKKYIKRKSAGRRNSASRTKRAK